MLKKPDEKLKSLSSYVEFLENLTDEELVDMMMMWIRRSENK